MASPDPAAHRALGAGEPDGTVFVFLDESFAPQVAAAAVVVESNDVYRLNSGIAAEYDRLRRWYHLEGLSSFEDFRRHGFHATSNPIEVKTAFVAFLTDVLNFKSLIIYSTGEARPDLSEKQHLIIVFDQLVHDVLLTYKSRPKIILYFESAGPMDRYVGRLVNRAVGSLGRYKPEVEVRFGTKRDPDLLAVADYVLHIFNQWAAKAVSGHAELDPRHHESRSLRAILGSISMARSIDDAQVVRRTLQP